jgi:hypothetical protein
MTFTLYQIPWVSKDKIEHNEMGGAYSACGGKERFIHVFWCRNMWQREHSEDIGVD